MNLLFNIWFNSIACGLHLLLTPLMLLLNMFHYSSNHSQKNKKPKSKNELNQIASSINQSHSASLKVSQASSINMPKQLPLIIILCNCNCNCIRNSSASALKPQPHMLHQQYTNNNNHEPPTSPSSKTKNNYNNNNNKQIEHYKLLHTTH